MTASKTLVLFHRDLRLDDNLALSAAVERGDEVVPVYIWSPDDEAPWQPGAATRWWLHHSLQSLDQQLRQLGSQLIIRRGPTSQALTNLLQETAAQSVFWNRVYEPAALARDSQLVTQLNASGVATKSFNSQLLFEPDDIRTREGRPYQVFTSYWRNCLAVSSPAHPTPAPTSLRSPKRWPESVPLASLKLLPRIPWDEGFRQVWQPGTQGAGMQWAAFLKSAARDYSTQRDFPATVGTSRLSPHLHFGEISPRVIWHTLAARLPPHWKDEQVDCGEKTFLKELVWREFAHHLLFHFPKTTDEPLRPEFQKFPWERNDEWLRAWQRGVTGFPIVDAGMRELWSTGWMHNRVRMIVASFLVKDLRLAWQAGAKWFWDTLVDADLANNTLGWQWSAGCGADAAPYFRIFNPKLQSEKFDPEGRYLKRWLPELARLPKKWIHEPHAAPKDVLSAAGVELGRNYPLPIVDHGDARKRALAAFQSLRGTSG